MESTDLKNWQQKSLEKQSKFKQFLKNSDKKKLLKHLPEAHEQAFEIVDCLTCANCCKNYSPRFKPPDVKRIAKYLKMSESDLKDRYLRRDEEGDFVVKQSPCPFLGSDNYCSIYEARPSDCHRFPYTDEDVLLKKQQITLKNSTFCPAVYLVLEKLMYI
jgi:Fe-S-cluster containining protein